MAGSGFELILVSGRESSEYCSETTALQAWTQAHPSRAKPINRNRFLLTRRTELGSIVVTVVVGQQLTL
jgi:hypothetical protein